MTHLLPTELFGEVVFLGVNPDRAVGLETESRARVTADLDGFVGDSHRGPTRGACVRVKRQYPKGALIRNVRQISIVSEEELAEIGAAMGLPDAPKPQWLGANVSLSGIPQLSALPPGARLIFERPDGGVGAALAVDLENGPCKHPGAVIERAHPGLGNGFAKHARGRRGLTGWIERAGEIALGMRCRLHTPPQRLYEPALGGQTTASR